MEEVVAHPSNEEVNSKLQHQETTPEVFLSSTLPQDQKQIKQSVQSPQPPEMHKKDEQEESEFLHLDEAIKKKLDAIESHKNIQEVPPSNLKSINPLKKPKQQSLINLSLSPKHQSSHPVNPLKKGVETDRISQMQIKRQFVHKLKEWSKQRQEIELKKQEIHARNLRQKQEEQQRRRKDKQAELQFHKLQKKKQLEHKINEIEERRKQREQSLKNAVLKRSYNGVPKYLEYQHKFQEKEEEKAIIDLKLIKNKKAKQSMDPEQLRAHQKAYIERIKERLNMKVHRDKDESQRRRTKSDFNLYLNKSQDLKKAELEKIIRRKKFQQKISKIPIKINEKKKQEVLISIDKSKNPHKYNLLSQKALNDKQIYEEFRDFDIDIDRKELGKNYLRELKNSPKKGLRAKAQSQMLIKHPEVESKQQFPKLAANQPQIPTKQITKSSSTFLQSSKSYENSLQKAKQRDSRYMKALKEKIAMVI